ncbi:MAG TPA: UDP-N-acetylmuramoyl-L-alanyl-D-glutamate--2,6-diaminopimelate ligase [Gemmatimonadaceae bacterium]|nr:UDP-N-acetylmuramoyl-L-alanyl-D-glutamate--2,6-diaminopimelate ligase [Gemmatimonadaceae bacterium]
MLVPLDRITHALRAAGLLDDITGRGPDHVTGIADDSRGVTPGALFIAIRGTASDGHDFLAAAADRGAGIAIVESAGRTTLPTLVVSNARKAAAVAAAAAFDWPARSLTLIGVTGTNGKTTTVSVLRHLLDEPPASAASLGTLGVLVGSAGLALAGGAGLTTPGPVELQRVFRALVDAGVRRVAMEVSSHALDQHRVEGVMFDAVVFTNLTHDHLDYHGTMDAYREAKVRLLDALGPSGSLVVNLDDPAWQALRTANRRVGFSIHEPAADVRAETIAFTPRGSQWTLRVDTGAQAAERVPVHLPLIGDFNVSNALGAAAAAWAIGVPPAELALRLNCVPQVPGRLEIIWPEPTILRDYAHTPDALARALDAVRPFARERLILVFGCGGDRDRAKRPLMGAIAEAKADIAIVTSDNPRTEDPEQILDDIEAGMRGSTHERIEDRRSAIGRALDRAGPGDLVILAGKGHETYQIRGTRRLPFDERHVVETFMRKRLGRGTGAGVGGDRNREHDGRSS